MMRVVRASDYREMPWKNGGGVTTEIGVFPAGAGLDGFDWRVSTARVERGGQFSLFPGVDRTLAILEGDAIELTVGGAAPVVLDAGSEAFFFAADVATSAILTGGPVVDLNVMTRRGRARHSVRRLDLSTPVEIPLADEVTLVFCVRGAVAVAGDVPLRLEAQDTLMADRRAANLRLEPGPPSTVFLIAISSGDHAR